VSLEGSISISEKNGDCVVIEIGHREVELLISVEITERHPERSQRGGKVGMGLEGAVALAQADEDRIVVLVGRGDIGYTVSVEVSTSNRYRSGLLWNVITYRSPYG